MRASILVVTCALSAEAFVNPSSSSRSLGTQLEAHKKTTNKSPKNALVSAALATSVLVAASNPLPSKAYIPSDYASDTVQEAVQALKDASGNADSTFKVYEDIAGIITEGKGVGGMVNYKGIQLERGYVADEDTSIYNPGLTLLTESEKERLVEGVILARKDGLAKGQWSENNEFAYEFLKTNLDPLHMVELSGYLGVVPFYGAFLYLVVLAVQQVVRGQFTPAYLIGIAAFVVPILALVAAGPQL